LKIVTILGTRPEIIRLSLIIKLLDQHADHLLVDTGQNYDDRLSGLFFRELEVRKPDISLGVRATRFGEQIGQILCGVESVLQAHSPDRVLILGDTNSGLSAIVARRLGIPVFHMEAGNRCYDFRVPEESNRRIIDHVSSVLLPYTSRSRENLIREGIPAEQIHVTGNPINEVIRHFGDKITRSQILASLELKEKQFFLVTMHRAENVDVENRLRNVVEALALLHEQYGFPVVVSLHPRTRSKATQFAVDLDRPGLHFVEPLGFADFICLEQNALCVLTDSGTVQEETCILRVPNVTIRDVTERPETVECGSNVLAGCDTQNILKTVDLVTSSPPNWQIPPEYLAPEVAHTVARIMMGSLP
jgi:UDP-N-acetylglucosamine 2-epimerase (non-hydrolysing)